jgi:hypothetical protein
MILMRNVEPIGLYVRFTYFEELDVRNIQKTAKIPSLLFFEPVSLMTEGNIDRRSYFGLSRITDQKKISGLINHLGYI